jgi:hypothetical protein
MNTVVMNDRDCLFEIVMSNNSGLYPSADSNCLALVRVLANIINLAINAVEIPNVAQMNELACWRVIAGLFQPTMDVSRMNKLACIRIFYTNNYSGTAPVAEFNELSLLRGIVQLIYP